MAAPSRAQVELLARIAVGGGLSEFAGQFWIPTEHPRTVRASSARKLIDLGLLKRNPVGAGGRDRWTPSVDGEHMLVTDPAARGAQLRLAAEQITHLVEHPETPIVERFAAGPVEFELFTAGWGSFTTVAAVRGEIRARLLKWEARDPEAVQIAHGRVAASAPDPDLIRIVQEAVDRTGAGGTVEVRAVGGAP